MNHRSQKYRLVKYDSLIDAEEGINRHFENEGFRVQSIHPVNSLNEDGISFTSTVYVLFERIEKSRWQPGISPISRSLLSKPPDPVFHKCWRCQKNKPESEMNAMDWKCKDCCRLSDIELGRIQPDLEECADRKEDLKYKVNGEPTFFDKEEVAIAFCQQKAKNDDEHVYHFYPCTVGGKIHWHVEQIECVSLVISGWANAYKALVRQAKQAERDRIRLLALSLKESRCDQCNTQLSYLIYRLETED